MAKPGRPRNPVAKNEMAGRSPSSRAANGKEPSFGDGIPACPEWFSERVQERWQFWCEQCLSIRGMIKQVDYDAWVIMATAWEDYFAASDLIRDEGHIATSDKGSPYMNPAVGIRMAAMKTIMTIARDYGFTPVSRAGLVFAPGEKEESVLSQLLKRRETRN